VWAWPDQGPVSPTSNTSTVGSRFSQRGVMQSTTHYNI
jgi:hypothetical protein